MARGCWANFPVAAVDAGLVVEEERRDDDVDSGGDQQLWAVPRNV